MKSLKSTLLLALAATSFASSVASAYIVPGDRNPPRYPERPDRPDRPGRPGDDYNRGDIVRSISLRRTVNNERLSLLRLIDLRNTRGLRVESIVVTADSSYANAELQLLINGRVEDYQRANSSQIYLNSRSGTELNSDSNALQLDVRGSLYIRSIEVRLSDRGGSSIPNRQIVPVSIRASIMSGQSVDIFRYINTRPLEGYVVEGMVIQGRARYRSGLVDVVQNGRRIASTLNLQEYTNAHHVQMFQTAVINSYTRLELAARGDIEIDRVELHLVRSR